MENIKDHTIQSLITLKDTDKALEAFGQVTVAKNSWFRFVKYDEKVHVDMRIETNKLEIFETFDKAIEEVDTFIEKNI